MNLSELPARFLPKQRQCSYRGCVQKHDWNPLFRSDSGIELQEQWLCSEECFLAAARDLLASLGEVRPVSSTSRTHLPLGLVMVSRGDLSSGQLRAALDFQQKSRPAKRIGDVLKELGVVGENEITRALAEQWSCPVFPLQAPENLAMTEHLPLHLLESYRMLPVHFAPAARILLLGFTDTLHHSVLYATEQMLGCRTEACLIQSSFYWRQLELLRASAGSSQIVIETNTTVMEAAQILLNYARQLESSKVRIVSCGKYLWIRLEPKTLHLLLRVPLTASACADDTFGLLRT
jgi:hypothetical protein